MKKKQSKVAAQKNANAEQATDFPLPEPMELARLAAILRPAAPSSPDALKAAVRCYFDAAVFAREQAASEIAALLSEKYKDERRKKAVEDIKKMQAAKWEDTVTFDEARELLAHP